MSLQKSCMILCGCKMLHDVCDGLHGKKFVYVGVCEYLSHVGSKLRAAPEEKTPCVSVTLIQLKKYNTVIPQKREWDGSFRR